MGNYFCKQNQIEKNCGVNLFSTTEIKYPTIEEKRNIMQKRLEYFDKNLKNCIRTNSQTICQDKKENIYISSQIPQHHSNTTPPQHVYTEKNHYQFLKDLAN